MPIYPNKLELEHDLHVCNNIHIQEIVRKSRIYNFFKDFRNYAKNRIEL